MTERDRNPDKTDLEHPLGITDEPIVTNAADQFERSTDPEQRRKRARALGEDGIEHPTDGLGDINTDPDGAAGIDMGYGGEGTDVTTRKR